MKLQTYHPHRRDNHSYYGATWATSQHRRAHRIWRRVFRGIVVVMALLPFVAAAVVIAAGGER